MTRVIVDTSAGAQTPRQCVVNMAAKRAFTNNSTTEVSALLKRVFSCTEIEAQVESCRYVYQIESTSSRH